MVRNEIIKIDREAPDKVLGKIYYNTHGLKVYTEKVYFYSALPSRLSQPLNYI